MEHILALDGKPHDDIDGKVWHTAPTETFPYEYYHGLMIAR